MLKRLTILATLFAASAAFATGGSASDGTVLERWQADPTQVFDAAEVDLEALQWVARPVIVFANTEVDPAFRLQLELLAERPDELAQRDVMLIIDTTPDEPSELRKKLRPRGFMLTLIGKDGGVKLRKPFPWDVRELTRSIDKMPLRQEELRRERSLQ